MLQTKFGNMSQAFRSPDHPIGRGRATPLSTTHNTSVGRADLLVLLMINSCTNFYDQSIKATDVVEPQSCEKS